MFAFLGVCQYVRPLVDNLEIKSSNLKNIKFPNLKNLKISRISKILWILMGVHICFFSCRCCSLSFDGFSTNCQISSENHKYDFWIWRSGQNKVSSKSGPTIFFSMKTKISSWEKKSWIFDFRFFFLQKCSRFFQIFRFRDFQILRLKKLYIYISEFQILSKKIGFQISPQDFPDFPKISRFFRFFHLSQFSDFPPE